MSDPIVINIDTSIFDRRSRELLDRVRNPEPLMQEFAGIMLDAVEENFAQEGRPDKWPELAESTKKQRAKKGHTGKKLQVSGSLAQSVFEEHGNDFAAVGSNKVYAAIHQFGGKAGRGRKVTIPARPFLGLDDDDMEELRDAAINFFQV